HFLYTLLSCSILSYTLNKVKYLEIGSVLPQLEAKQTTETFEPLDPLEQLEH
ncbi:membrane protein, partial [Enterococcus faecium]